MAVEIVESLKKLGLTQNEAQVFIALYQKSPQYATNLAVNAKVSRGRIYEILQSLEGHGLIISNRIKGGSNLYSLTDYPNCLNKFKTVKVKEIENIFNEVISHLETIERTEFSAFLLTSDDFSVIKGEKSNAYYIEQILNGSKKSVLTNFTSDMLIEYKQAIISTKDRGIAFTFVMSDTDFENPEVKTIIKGSKIYMLSINRMPSPIISVFKDVRPSMIIIDDNEIAIIRFYKQTVDSLMIRNPDLIKYQRYVLDLFMKGGEEIDLD